jgi:hypothetical protein
MDTPEDKATEIETLANRLRVLGEEREELLAKRNAATSESDRVWYSAQLVQLDLAIHKVRNELLLKRNVVN